MNMTLIREGENPKHNFGQLYVDGLYFGETLEDEDRFLESDPTAKVQDQTAIPRGRYLVTLSLSKRFGKIMPEVHDVSGFSGIRIHGGNYAGLETKYVTINRDILKDAFYSEGYLDVYDDKEKR